MTVVTFLFIYRQHRLPGVHSLVFAIGWIAYMVTQFLRPTLMAIGPAPWGLVTIAELLDMGAWVIIFLGLILKPPFAKPHISFAPPEESYSPELVALGHS
jgi:hypothetical protein